ncbi:hypothetical protein [Spelaeicoccus albus]
MASATMHTFYLVRAGFVCPTKYRTSSPVSLRALFDLQQMGLTRWGRRPWMTS